MALAGDINKGTFYIQTQKQTDKDKLMNYLVYICACAQSYRTKRRDVQQTRVHNDNNFFHLPTLRTYTRACRFIKVKLSFHPLRIVFFQDETGLFRTPFGFFRMFEIMCAKYL